jgi:hypothetical protein
MCGAAFLSKSSSPAPDVTPPSVTGLAVAPNGTSLVAPVTISPYIRRPRRRSCSRSPSRASISRRGGQALIAVTATKVWAVTLSPTGAIP